MTLPRVRFTVRRMMVAVALLAVLIRAGDLGLRRAEYLRRAGEPGLVVRP